MTVRALVAGVLLCPECRWALALNNDRDALACENSHCHIYGALFKVPTVELELDGRSLDPAAGAH